MLIQFRYAGRLIDDKMLQTQLSDIGIQVENDDDQPITFNSNNPLPSASFVLSGPTGPHGGTGAIWQI
ncbi:hypothetical protein SGGMMB4_00334 [Sodalis glossinidius str. 'morsitans']|uniref:Uncharacterized protein n=1 Tax=Sodalis glossinidius (strain morsitans) TaxID=343509 RepID=A0A193QF40_SODGM|nr:hypothetical protein [Sodalis glossinidius]CRL43768.1 hypothetical protein SGGMMB4_00334 [Sodalis glossinidius str. 'morsitans']